MWIIHFSRAETNICDTFVYMRNMMQCNNKHANGCTSCTGVSCACYDLAAWYLLAKESCNGPSEDVRGTDSLATPRVDGRQTVKGFSVWWDLLLPPRASPQCTADMGLFYPGTVFLFVLSFFCKKYQCNARIINVSVAKLLVRFSKFYN